MFGVRIVILLAVSALLSGCLFGNLDREVEDALAAIDDTELATADEVEDILDYNWLGKEGSAEISIDDGVLTVIGEGEIGDDKRTTKSTRVFEFEQVDEDGYARFKLTEGRMCVGASRNCNRDIGGSATIRVIKSLDTKKAVLVIGQMNALGDNSPIPFYSNSIYSGTGEFLFWSWVYR